MNMRRMTVAIVIAVVLTAIPFVLDWFDFPTSVVEYLFVPGMLCASVLYPQGSHSGSGHPEAILVAGLFNVVVYSVLFYVLLGLFGKRRVPRVEQKADSPNDTLGQNTGRE